MKRFLLGSGLLALAGCLVLAFAQKRTPPESATLPPSKLTPLATKGTVEKLRPLYSLEVDEKSEGGQPTKLSIQETKRHPRTSLVTYKFTSGGSVGSSMTVVLAMYRIALDRGAKYFVLLQDKSEPDGRKYLVGFSEKEEADPAKFFGITGSLKEEIHWWSVTKLDKMFGPQAQK